MDSNALEHLPAVGQLAGMIVSVLTVGWGGFRWLRGQIREEFGGDAFRQAVRAESIEALKAEAGQKELAAAVARGLTGVAERQNQAIGDIDRRLSEQGKRLGEVEQRVAGLEGRFSEELGRLQRLMTKLYRALKRAGVIRNEETEG